MEEYLAESASEKAPQSLSPETLAKARATLAWALVRWRRLPLMGTSGELLEAGLQNTYRRARCGHAAFLRELSDVNAHEWRKAVEGVWLTRGICSARYDRQS
jgi:hypothetical protein